MVIGYGCRCRKKRGLICRGLTNREVKDATNLLSKRNFDPETRTIRRPDITANNDTVEKDVDGMVDRILEADKERQNAELVRDS